MKYTKKQLMKAVKEVNENLGIEPPISGKSSIEEINAQFKEALLMLCSDDKFSQPTQKVIDAFIEELTGKKQSAEITVEEAEIIELDGIKYKAEKIVDWTYDENFNKIYTPMSEADTDWIRTGRLSVKARAGDKEAAKELEKLRNAPVYRYKRIGGKGAGQEENDEYL